MNHDAAPKQLTFRAVALAIVLAVVLSAANAYLGLFAGLTIATAIPAAVISMGVLRLLGWWCRAGRPSRTGSCPARSDHCG